MTLHFVGAKCIPNDRMTLVSSSENTCTFSSPSKMSSAFSSSTRGASFTHLVFYCIISTAIAVSLPFESSSFSRSLSWSTDQSKLLKTPKKHTKLVCLRLYTQRKFQGSWSDICSSNEVLMVQSIFNTRSVCAPQGKWPDSNTYWLLFERPYFIGSYVMLSPNDCVRNLQSSLSTVGSVLKCTSSGLKISCVYPPKPWLGFGSYSQTELEAQEQEVEGVKSEISASWSRTGQGEPETKFTSVDLSSVEQGGVSWKLQDS
ncbi:hypothetical protein T265_07516 [Opisthorchis viverrini]|uniref:Interleukin-4 inducing immunoglobulin-binding domain-containing protein n=1 Tax=Opisthorchis viverrini TaxID=6198 RepID=A0A074ZCD1_OPIVI|nr:hypothetical protein T265_07516 [Opisthorchis viverrini]KER24956.1 hypothetical protein T265_07516 [Opisthorchis viverrini]